MSYNKYPKEMKEAIIARMLEGDETVTDIQRDTGVDNMKGPHICSNVDLPVY